MTKLIVKEVNMSKKEAGLHEACMSAKDFFHGLEKFAPKLHKKLINLVPDNKGHCPISMDEIKTELKKESPEFFKKLEACNFKFSLDEGTKNEANKIIKKAHEEVANFEKAVKGMNKK